MPKKIKNQESIDITPSIRFFSTLSSFPYKPHFALSEFIDNSIQSFLDNEKELLLPNGKPQTNCLIKLKIDNTLNTITIEDNCHGIRDEDLQRAFTTAETPPDAGDGLSEFGIGMKYAAFHFSPRWKVVTSALGEPKKKTITMDLEKINEGEYKIEPEVEEAEEREHYTKIILENCFEKNFPRAHQTKSKIQRHMEDIYRLFMRDQKIIIKFGEATMKPQPLEIYQGPVHGLEEDESAKKFTWKKSVDIDLGINEENQKPKKAKGWVGMREEGSFSTGGLSIFRNRRMFLGSGEEPHYPTALYGDGGSHSKLRLIGEINLENFSVAHTKDAIQWAGSEETLYEEIKKILKPYPTNAKTKFLEAIEQGVSDEDLLDLLPLRDQIVKYRTEETRKKQKEKEKDKEKEAQELPDTTKQILDDVEKSILETDAIGSPNLLNQDDPEEEPAVVNLDSEDLTTKTFSDDASKYVFKIDYAGIEKTYDSAPLFQVGGVSGEPEIEKSSGKKIYTVEMTINPHHGLMVLFHRTEGREALIRMICLLGLSETKARSSIGGKKGKEARKAIGNLRRLLNHYAEAFSNTDE